MKINKISQLVIMTFLSFALINCAAGKAGADGKIGATGASGGLNTPDVYKGGMVWDNWTETRSGGTGVLPTGVTNVDFVRCESCHGWDALGASGADIARSSSSSWPSVNRRTLSSATGSSVYTANLMNSSSNSSAGNFTLGAVLNFNGRALSEVGYSASSTTAAGTLELMPNFGAVDGLTAQQVLDVAVFLNSGPKLEDVATITSTLAANYTQSTVVVTFHHEDGSPMVAADEANGKTLYEATCIFCHGTNGKGTASTGTVGDVASVEGTTGLGAFLGDGLNMPRYSQAYHKATYGDNADMTRAAAGNLSKTQVRDVLYYLQRNDSPNGGAGTNVFID